MRVIVIGGVAGGMSAATRLRRLNETAEIIVIEKSGHVSYANCGLPYYVGGVIEQEKDLLLQTPESLHARFRLDVRVSTEVLAINPAKKTVAIKNLKSGETAEIDYDKLILSPGASPVVPPIPGIERGMTLRTVEDVEKIASSVGKNPASAVVIGGGFIGVEIAENLIHRKIPTALVEATQQVLMPLDPELATLVAHEMRANGVDLRLGASVVRINPDSVELSNGEVLRAEIVILAIGVRPEIGLAKAAGLEIGTRNGIKVDEFNRTSQKDIYAVGDAAEKIDALDGNATLVPLANLANRHGRVVSDHISGLTVRPVKTIGTAIV
jgi:NADPH-dependent 2,4-dienoyl-CoA reductase/sulfur reductase-like enzyme